MVYRPKPGRIEVSAACRRWLHRRCRCYWGAFQCGCSCHNGFDVPPKPRDDTYVIPEWQLANHPELADA